MNIDRDEGYQRDYIPVAPGWEVQTKGKGSTFRIAERKGHDDWDRWTVPDAPYLHDTVARMARAVHADRTRLVELLKAAKCPECDGSGARVELRTVPRCCGCFLGTGECCGCHIPDQKAEQVQCQWCDEKTKALA